MDQTEKTIDGLNLPYDARGLVVTAHLTDGKTANLTRKFAKLLYRMSRPGSYVDTHNPKHIAPEDVPVFREQLLIPGNELAIEIDGQHSGKYVAAPRARKGSYDIDLYSEGLRQGSMSGIRKGDEAYVQLLCNLTTSKKQTISTRRPSPEYTALKDSYETLKEPTQRRPAKSHLATLTGCTD